MSTWSGNSGLKARSKAAWALMGIACRKEFLATFYGWMNRLREGIPEALAAEEAVREQTEKGEAMFLSVSLKASPVEIQLPNGGVVRLPLSVGRAVLMEVVRWAGALRPWKPPNP